MSSPVIAFFNTRRGTGKTTLVNHLAWLFADLGLRVLAVDLDPQVHLTSAMLDDDRLEILWPEMVNPDVFFGAIESYLQRFKIYTQSNLQYVSEDRFTMLNEPTRIALLPGDLSLALTENTFSEAWPRCLEGDVDACHLISIFWNAIQHASSDHHADLVLMDLGSNLGGINRAALIAADYVVIPLSEEVLSLQGLQESGAALRHWREEWKVILGRNVALNLELPAGRTQPLGYVFIQPLVRLDRPVRPSRFLPLLLPQAYRANVLDQRSTTDMTIATDPECLAVLKNYLTIMPLAQEARKPMFHLKPADGALGSELQAALAAYREFKQLAERIAERTNITIPRLST